MAAIVQRWRRALFVGCSHGIHVDPAAVDAVLKMRDNWKPQLMVHLGDFMDTTAFRSGARGTSDESEPIAPDVDAGLAFLEQLKCTHVLCGNHEARVYRMMGSTNAIVASCAEAVVRGIEQKTRKLKAKLATYDGIWQDVRLGPVRAMHGVFYSENSTRDHAEAFGLCVHAHSHRAAVAKGRRADNPTAYCVGTLTTMGAMDYANTRRATLSWSQGFVWGEISDTQAVLWLHEQTKNTPWRLPV